MGRFYIWFVVIVAGLAGAIRMLLPRRFAELQLYLGLAAASYITLSRI